MEADLSPVTAHVDAIARTFEDTLARVVPELRDPRTLDSERLDKLIDSVVETAVGFAVGLAAGDLIRAIDVWLGAAIADGVRMAIHQAPGSAGHPAPVFTSATVVADLEARLRFRLRIAAGELRTLFDHALRGVPADREAALVAALAMARHGSLLGERLGTAITQGWRFACAAIDGTEPPVLDRGSPSHALWHRWSRLAGVAAAPTLESYIVTM